MVIYVHGCGPVVPPDWRIGLHCEGECHVSPLVDLCSVYVANVSGARPIHTCAFSANVSHQLSLQLRGADVLLMLFQLLAARVFQKVLLLQASDASSPVLTDRPGPAVSRGEQVQVYQQVGMI